MKKKNGFSAIFTLLTVLAAAVIFSSCDNVDTQLQNAVDNAKVKVQNTVDDAKIKLQNAYDEVFLEEAELMTASTETNLTSEEQSADNVTVTEATPPVTTAAQTAPVTTTPAPKTGVEKDGSYTTPEDVAEYIHTFGTLPKNFITKDEAKAMGWDSKAGNLNDVAPGKSIGGDYFGNYEGLLPKADGRKYTECDVNYSGGYRGAERIIFSNDGLIYYTNDHYESFTQLY